MGREKIMKVNRPIALRLNLLIGVMVEEVIEQVVEDYKDNNVNELQEIKSIKEVFKGGREVSWIGLKGIKVAGNSIARDEFHQNVRTMKLEIETLNQLRYLVHKKTTIDPGRKGFKRR